MTANTLKNLTNDWANFCRLKRILTPPEEITALDRFGYRYRLAKSLTGLQADGVGRSLLTYGAVSKLLLAYTTYESIIPTAVRLRRRGFEHLSRSIVFSKDLAHSVRSNVRLKQFLLEYIFRNDLKAKSGYLSIAAQMRLFA